MGKRNQISKMIYCFVIQGVSTFFVSDIWQYKPIIIVLAVGGLIILFLSVTADDRTATAKRQKAASNQRSLMPQDAAGRIGLVVEIVNKSGRIIATAFWHPLVNRIAHDHPEKLPGAARRA